MNVLIINHHFDQDIDALKCASHDDVVIRQVSYAYFHVRAGRYFPDAVFSGGLEEYHRPRHAAVRERWKVAARKAIYELYYIFPFDVVISPSDTFFYVRDVVRAVQDLGCPFFVVQKETTISEYVMDSFSTVLGQLFPFIGDYMTVCSHRHKEFWLRAGAPDEKIEVTGQPRFDYYGRSRREISDRKKETRGVRSERRTILFFSYMLDAYIPLGDRDEDVSWADLRLKTEDILLSLVRERNYDLLIKPHPQQSPSDIINIGNRLQSIAPLDVSSGRVSLRDKAEDTRSLISRADIIVGFQTTALYEALAAGKQVIYAAWGGTVERFREQLIPFHEYPNVIHHAWSPEALQTLILRHSDHGISELDEKATSVYEKHIGIVDGDAAARVWAAVRRVVSDKAPDQRQLQLRGRLQSESESYRDRELSIARVYLVLWALMQLLSYPICWLFSNHRCLDGIDRRLEQQRLRCNECKTSDVKISQDQCLIGRPIERVPNLVSRLRPK